MDLAAVVVPGAQSVVTAILTDTWKAARAVLERAWTRSHGQQGAGEGERGGQAGHELDVVRRQSLEIAGQGSAQEREMRMGLFWAGYLAAQANAHPELVELLAELPALLAGNAGGPVSTSTSTHNTLSGTVHGSVVQTGSVQGSITFGKA